MCSFLRHSGPSKPTPFPAPVSTLSPGVRPEGRLKGGEGNKRIWKALAINAMVWIIYTLQLSNLHRGATGKRRPWLLQATPFASSSLEGTEVFRVEKRESVKGCVSSTTNDQGSPSKRLQYPLQVLLSRVPELD